MLRNVDNVLYATQTYVDTRVRFDTAEQNLTEQEKQNARTNIGAVSDSDSFINSLIF